MQESKFDGGLLGLIGIGILSALLTFVTLGLGAPWAVCLKEKWYASHTIIDGQRLTFDGNGAQLFGNYIKNDFCNFPLGCQRNSKDIIIDNQNLIGIGSEMTVILGDIIGYDQICAGLFNLFSCTSYYFIL